MRGFLKWFSLNKCINLVWVSLSQWPPLCLFNHDPNGNILFQLALPNIVHSWCMNYCWLCFLLIYLLIMLLVATDRLKMVLLSLSLLSLFSCLLLPLSHSLTLSLLFILMPITFSLYTFEKKKKRKEKLLRRYCRANVTLIIY